MDRAQDILQHAPDAKEYEALRAIDPAERTPFDHALLAEAAWWHAAFEESMSERQQAYAGFAAAGDDRLAGLMAARLSIEFAIHGEPAVGAGFLERAKRHLRDQPDCVERGFVTMVETSMLRMEGRAEDALTHAEEAVACAERFANDDLLAMSLHVEGLLLLDMGRVADGLARMDEAMALILAGTISPYFTGIVYCALIQACLELSDIRRAGDWSDAAGVWCEALPPEAPIVGFCRVNRAEVARIRGAWAEAEAAAALAVEELAAIDPASAGLAQYQIGEIRRRRGDLAGAAVAYGRAHELGADPQPGLALLRLAQGDAEVAAAALRTALASTPTGPRRSRVLAASVEVALATGDIAGARASSDELAAIADAIGTHAMEAAAAAADGAVLLAEGDAENAADRLRIAVSLGQDVRTPDETARARARYGEALRALGDDEGARLALIGALAAFEELGAEPDAETTRRLLGTPGAIPGGLTAREAEVLRLLAAGKTNRDIGVELVISEHTVARHIQNIYAKVGVSSRAAATAFAFAHDLA
ncbi:MAG: LuxR C-terminal-related transcriptional regulator [Actinomycetota bacterium]